MRMRGAFIQNLKLIPKYLKFQKLNTALLGIGLIISIGLELLAPQILRDFIDTATSGGVMRELIMLALYFIGVVITNQIFSTINTYLSENIGWTATNLLRNDLIEHCLNLDMSYHNRHTPGEMVERIDGDVTVLSNFFSMFALKILGSFLLLIGVLVMLYREAWQIGLTFTLFSILAVISLNYIRSRAIAQWLSMRQINSDFFGFLGEHLEGTEDIRSSGASAYVMYRFHEFLQRWLPIRSKAEFAGYKMAISTLAIFSLGSLASLGLSAFLWLNGLITIGTVYLIFYYVQLLRHPIELLYQQMEDLPKASASIERVEALLATPSKILDNGKQIIAPGPISVKFDDVSFTYESGSIVEVPTNGQDVTDATTTLSPNRFRLKHITLELEPGETLGLVGHTGSGKTSLVRLLLRFYEADDGTITLNNIPVTDISLKSLRRHISMVTQDVQIFAASIRNNLTFFDHTVPDEKIRNVLGQLGLAKMYQSLPNGLDTILGSSGIGLSAGEAQLLAAARSFLADPGLVILDEASSRLDVATEQLLQQAVDKLLQNRTAIIIAHKLETVQRTDKIMILEKGQIVEYGKRQELASDENSRFSQLLKTGLEEIKV